jgi:hypothetical protein
MADRTRQPDRQFILDGLRTSEAGLLAAVHGVTAAQWQFRESPGRWSIAENLEHLVLFEDFIRAAVAGALTRPAEPDKQVTEKDPLVLDLAAARATTRFAAREAARPAGRWTDSGDLLAELHRARAQTIAFAAHTTADLRSHFFAHIAFGDLDCHQWLVLLARHMDRHALQIAQVKADAAWPG